MKAVLRHRRLLATVGVWLLVFASVVSWRRGVIFSGAIDPTVVAKAGVAVVAFAAALLLRRTTPFRRPLSPLPVLIVAVIVVLALAGSSVSGHLLPNLVLTVRIVLLTGTILAVLNTTPTDRAVGTMLAAMASIGLVAAATGAVVLVATHGHHGRLGGGIPPLEPNELATLVLPPAIGLVYVLARRGVRPLPTIGLLVLAAVIVATGSRTALGMLALGGAIVLVACWRTLSRWLVVAVLVVALIGIVVVCFTGVLDSLVLRGQSAAQLGTLNSRTISWQVVLATPVESWSWWIGNGLSEKTVPVLGQYWSQQVFDSSWISSLAQDGAVGTVVLALYVAGTLVFAARSRAIRPLVLAIVVTTVIRSFVENGLIESSTTYTLFFVLATLTWPGANPPRPRRPQPVGTPKVVTVPARLLVPAGQRTAPQD